MTPFDLRLIVGLGNPGSKYRNTRHNIGFMALEQLANKESVEFQPFKKLSGQIALINSSTGSQRLLMPNTYMNESGRSIRAAMDWFNLESSQILIIVDDMDLPLGRIRMRIKGGSGGHKGLKSAISHIGTENFCRIRIGIGAPGVAPLERKAKTNNHVLGAFYHKEIDVVKRVLNEVTLCFEAIKDLSIERAINRINSYKDKYLEEQD